MHASHVCCLPTAPWFARENADHGETCVDDKEDLFRIQLPAELFQLTALRELRLATTALPAIFREHPERMAAFSKQLTCVRFSTVNKAAVAQDIAGAFADVRARAGLLVEGYRLKPEGREIFFDFVNPDKYGWIDAGWIDGAAAEEDTDDDSNGDSE